MKTVKVAEIQFTKKGTKVLIGEDGDKFYVSKKGKFPEFAVGGEYELTNTNISEYQGNNMEWVNEAITIRDFIQGEPKRAAVKVPEHNGEKHFEKHLEKPHKEDGMTIGNAANNASHIVNCMKDIVIARGKISSLTDEEFFNILTAWWDQAFDSVLATTTGKKKVKTFEDAAATEVVE